MSSNDIKIIITLNFIKQKTNIYNIYKSNIYKRTGSSKMNTEGEKSTQ